MSEQRFCEPPFREPPFREPNVQLDRIYTRGGDAGETSLAGGQRVGKDHLRIEVYGTVDELNAFLGLACVSVDEAAAALPALAELARILHRIQHELFNLGSALATPVEQVPPRQPQITAASVAQLEREIDRFNADLPELSSFVLPGGPRLNAELHACRTICRRAERRLVQLARTEQVDALNIHYLNRLSDALFVWSRWVNRALGAEEILWNPNLPTAFPAEP
jgi:cob(I)alamin adenosyltransferase